MSENECTLLLKGLEEILELWKINKFSIEKSHEDSHTAIEAYLTHTYGEVGKKIHTARSRNDQALVTIRLFTLDKVHHICELLKALINSFETKISQIGEIKMPGYTHTQRAMPTTVGMWLGSFKNALEDDSLLINAAYNVNNQNPL